MNVFWLFFLAAIMSAADAPVYSALTIVPSGSREAAPHAPGRLASIYGQHLGAGAACNGAADPRYRETPNPSRLNQTPIETQVFPKRLCDVMVRVNGVPAGLLYVAAGQINFKMPQETPVQGTVDVQVLYQGRSGPIAKMTVERPPEMGSAQQLADKMWSGLQTIQWESAYQAQPKASRSACKSVPTHSVFRGGLYGYAYYCAKSLNEVVGEYLYYPADPAHPVILLRRAEFRLVNPYPEISVEVEQLLRQRLIRAYGRGTVPGNMYELGLNPPNPGLRWQAGGVSIFLHRNRNYVEPAGIREGVQLIAVRKEVLEEREQKLELEKAFRSSTKLSHPVIEGDLKKELGDLYLVSGKHPASEPERLKAERETRTALLRLLRYNGGDRNRRAAALAAADELAGRLGTLLVVQSVVRGSEVLREAPDLDIIRRQLAPYGIQYTGPGHYSGYFEYDWSLLRRAWKEFPETPWGQRAFLMLQSLSCSIPQFGCQGPNCFREVIRQGEKFLRGYPDTALRKEENYHLAVAYETCWSLSKAAPGDPTAEGAMIDKASSEMARKRAIELYEELMRTAPGSPQARSGEMRLPRLKLSFGTGERAFFCFVD